MKTNFYHMNNVSKIIISKKVSVNISKGQSIKVNGAWCTVFKVLIDFDEKVQMVYLHNN